MGRMELLRSRHLLCTCAWAAAQSAHKFAAVPRQVSPSNDVGEHPCSDAARLFIATCNDVCCAQWHQRRTRAGLGLPRRGGRSRAGRSGQAQQTRRPHRQGLDLQITHVRTAFLAVVDATRCPRNVARASSLITRALGLPCSGFCVFRARPARGGARRSGARGTLTS